MEKTNNIKYKNLKNKLHDKPPIEIKPVTDGQIENNMNSKILKITMWIKDHYPELSQYLEEMPVTIPSVNDPEITLNQLKSYYESLISLLKKYKVDYPKIEE